MFKFVGATRLGVTKSTLYMIGSLVKTSFGGTIHRRAKHINTIISVLSGGNLRGRPPSCKTRLARKQRAAALPLTHLNVTLDVSKYVPYDAVSTPQKKRQFALEVSLSVCGRFHRAVASGGATFPALPYKRRLRRSLSISSSPTGVVHYLRSDSETFLSAAATSRSTSTLSLLPSLVGQVRSGDVQRGGYHQHASR